MSPDVQIDIPPDQQHQPPVWVDDERSDLDRTGTENGARTKNGTAPTRSKPMRLWSIRQMGRLGLRTAVILVLFGSLGGLLFPPPSSNYVSRTEFVYTLDESVPDSFLREDRRLLTQIATLESDAVLTPVADRFGVSTDDVRDAMAVATVDLSEVLRLDVRGPSPDRALALSEAIMAEYAVVASQPPSSDLGAGLGSRRSEIVSSLADADSALLAMKRGRSSGPSLATAEESLERRIDYRSDQVIRLQKLLDDSLVKPISQLRRANLNNELAQAQVTLAALETELSGLRTTITDSEAETTEELALLREIARLEAELGTIDDQLTLRELRPLLSPIRVLGEPTVVLDDAILDWWRGPAIGLLVALPFAAAVAYRGRQRQLWLGK